MARPERTARLWLHIGLPKTGTSAVQSSFADGRPALERSGILYPRTGEVGGGHARLAWPFLSPVRKERADIVEKLTEVEAGELWSSLADEVAASDAPTVVLSSEYFSETDPADLIDHVGRVSDDVRILVYLRRQDELIESGYNQEVKAGLTATPFRMPSRQAPAYDYAALLARWGEAFGADRLTVRLYDGSVAQRGGEKDVAEVLGIDASLLPPATSGTNVSLHPALIELQRQLNAMGAARADLVPRLQAIVASSPDEPIPHYLDVEQRRAILELYAESNRAVAREYFGIQNGHLFPQPDDGHPRTARTEAIELLASALAATWQELESLRREITELKGAPEPGAAAEAP